MINMMIGKKYGNHPVIFDSYVKSPAFFLFFKQNVGVRSAQEFWENEE